MSDFEKIANFLTEAQSGLTSLISKKKAHAWIDAMLDLLFPLRCETKNSELLLIQNAYSEFVKLITFNGRTHLESKTIADTFFSEIPVLYKKLMLDAEAFLEFDPAAKSIEEIIVAYPGFYAIAVYRISHNLWLKKVDVLPRLISEWAHSQTGIDIHPGAKIANRFFIDHGTGIVIGETAEIGENVKIYQGVTLGALSVNKSDADIKRHPSIEKNVVIYSGTTILGGKTVVGHDSVIGGNVWLTESVPSFSLVYHKSEIRVRNNYDFIEPINFQI